MAMTIKQLSSDAAFLLSFEPIQSDPLASACTKSFRILLDPWITPSKKGSRASQVGLPLNSILDIPEPDVIVLSSKEDDHCNEQTLRQLPRRSNRMIILGDAQTTKRVRSWNHFNDKIIHTLEPWVSRFAPNRKGNGDNVARIEVPSPVPGGTPGEVTIALLAHKKESAIGITYTPPQCYDGRRRSVASSIIESPISPNVPMFSPRSSSLPRHHSLTKSASDLSMRRRRSHARHQSMCSPSSPLSGLNPLRASKSIANIENSSSKRGISVIFSPHGIPYHAVEPYATSHLLAQAVLPLTALMHCFDSVSYPWWSRNIPSTGMDTAQQTASTLGARVCISTHDGNKFTRGLFGKFKSPRRTKYDVDDVKDMVDAININNQSNTSGTARSRSRFTSRSMVAVKPTEALVLRCGETVTLTGEGVLEMEDSSSGEFQDEDNAPPVPPLPTGFYPTPQSSFEWLPGPC